MPEYRTIAFSRLELKGLWVRGTGGSTAGDALLDRAADTAVHKVYCAEKGISPLTSSHGPKRPKRGPDLDLRRRAGGSADER